MFRPTRFLRYASSNSHNWSDTLALPKPTFPARPTAQNLLKYRQRCSDDLYAWQKENRPNVDEDGNDNVFVLHDGPPYANGAVHVGHALNKILKDIIIRTNLSSGKRVEYRPGWDCHGLPIELKALQAQTAQKTEKKTGGDHDRSDSAVELEGAKKDAGLGPLAIRKAARRLAQKTIEDQKANFRAWGVMGDWDSPYLTMNKDFEIRQLNVFKEMVAKRLIYRQNKPVHWSPSSRTALAEAELEYDENHRVTAAFVKFPIVEFPSILSTNDKVKKDQVSALIWTTTPWTLPANKAIGIRSDIEYCLVEFHHESAPPDLQGQMLVAKERLEPLLTHLPDGTEAKMIIDSIPGSALLEGCQYINVISTQTGRIIDADFVTATSGTGLVHMAPGHGMEDYKVLTKLGIGSAFAPVDDDGKFTDEALPQQPDFLKGLYVETKGAKAVLELLRNPTAKPLSAPMSFNHSLVLAAHDFRHKNPIDWRTKQPIITRATDQWFADVGVIQEAAINSLSHVKFIPESGKSRLQSFLQGRSQWCISRQRSWGVPIPALFKKDTGEAVMTVESIQHIINVIQERGTDAWWSDAEDETAWISPSLQPGEYVRGKDTMDVWFDSGTAWTSLSPRQDGSPADVFLEGSDQHRGWFQSSLLTYIACQGPSNALPPFKTLITHGFTLDQEGRKMSKSIGNVITPEEILTGSLIPAVKNKGKGKGNAQPTPKASTRDLIGPDVLRLWVASSDYSRDVVIGQQTLQAVHRDLQKYRVTFRWLLGVLNDYPVAIQQRELLKTLRFSDKIVLHRLAKVSATVQESNNQYEYYKSVASINRFVNADLSAFYFEVVKDRMYAGDEEIRAHTQTVLYAVFHELLHMLTPICPHLVEEVWAHVPEETKEEVPHPLQRIWNAPFNFGNQDFDETEFEAQIDMLMNVSTAAKAAQEDARRRGKLGSSLACEVEILLPDNAAQSFVDLFAELEEQTELSELFVVSNAEVYPSNPEDRKEIDTEMMQGAEDEVREALEKKLKWRASVPWQTKAEFECGTPDEPATGTVVVLPPSAVKCVRCWQYTAPTPTDPCQRCVDVLGLDDEGEDGEDDDDEGDEGDEGDDDVLTEEVLKGMSKEQLEQLLGKMR